MAGWILRASGDSDDPAAHKHLLERVAELLGHREYGTGSSEFSSAHATAANFHEGAAEEEPPVTGVPAAGQQEAGSPPVPGGAPGTA